MQVKKKKQTKKRVCFNSSTKINKQKKKGIVSKVPEKGTVGASGDLAPLAHLIVGFLGIGELWNPKTNQWEEAAKVLSEFEFVRQKKKFVFCFFQLFKFFFYKFFYLLFAFFFFTLLGHS